LTGKKYEQKIYKHHSGFIGGLKEVPISQMRTRRPEEVGPEGLDKGEMLMARSSEEPFLACCPKTLSVIVALID
jgi:hypothetical protein